MASGTPVGNMIIRVDLDAVGLEKSMTGLQRQLKSSNKAMGAQLSAFDRGEKSASKYGVLIEGLSNRHKIQGQMVDEARAKYNQMSETYGENSVKAQQASQQLNEQIKKYQETGRELSQVQAEYKEFQRLQEIQSKSWYKTADSIEEYGGKLKTAGTEMDETGRTLTKKVSVPLGVVGGLAIKTGSDFESGMSRVGAISGASASDMAKLEVKAREMGATTVFSASEASDAFYYMSLAGWSAEESMDGISGVMDLAAASGEDLSTVADIVTDSLTSFGLQAKDSGRMADVLASASANANTDVSGLGQAFQYVAPVAGALGYTIEDTSKAIGLMSNAGIKSTKAGTALRTMMTNLTSDSDKAKKNMEKYGISLTDSSGNMKSFDEVMLDLRKNLGGLDKEQQAQAATTLFGKEAMSGALAIINASESDYKKLTKAIEESDGSASDMADTMQGNLQGSLKELRSMMEDLFITMYKNLKPALESTVDGAKDLTQWFANLSPETQELITKMGLLAFTGGPVISMTGKLTSGLGSVMETTGGLVKAIGTAEGSGLLAGLNYLGPGAVAGIAVAGIGAVAYGVQHFKKKAEKANEVNLDLAQSFTEQATDLQKNVDTFNRLRGKAKLSNDELYRMNDINEKLKDTTDPYTIEQLKDEFGRLAKKSGMSKDEMKELFEANQYIIEQSPEVEKSTSDVGNQFVENTEKAQEYINKLKELAIDNLERERQKLLLQEKDIRTEIGVARSKERDIQKVSNKMQELENKSVAELKELYKENRKTLNAANHTKEEGKVLEAEQNALIALRNGDEDEYRRLKAEALDITNEQLGLVREEISGGEEKLEQLSHTEEQMANIYLEQVGITEEGEKGLAQLDKKISKNQEELMALEEKKEKGKQLTAEEQKRYEKLQESVSEQTAMREKIYEELGLYNKINSIADIKLAKLDEEKRKKIESKLESQGIKDTEKDIISQMDEKLSKERDTIAELEREREKQGANKAEIDGQIESTQKKISEIGRVKKEVLQELGIWDDLDSSIRDGINSEIKKGEEVSNTTNKQKKQGDQIDNNNKKTDEGIKKEKERSAEAGRDVDKGVDASDNGTVADIDMRVEAAKKKPISVVDLRDSIGNYDKQATAGKKKPITSFDYRGTLSGLNRQGSLARRKPITSFDSRGSLSNIDLRASLGRKKPVTFLESRNSLTNLNNRASSPVTKFINFVTKGRTYAKGTPPSGHPGGMAVVGDGGGRELVTLPDGRSFLSPATDTLLDLPRGTHVTPNKSTERLIRNIPKYATGTEGWQDGLKDSEFARLLVLNSRESSTVTIKNNESNQGLVKLLEATLQQNQILMEILKSQDKTTQAIENKGTDIIMDSKTVGKIVSNTINKNITEDNWAKGGI